MKLSWSSIGQWNRRYCPLSERSATAARRSEGNGVLLTAKGIDVSDAQIVSAWRRLSSTDLWLTFRPAGNAPDRHLLAGALDAANAAAEARGQLAWADGPFPDSTGAGVWRLLVDRAESAEALVAWLRDFTGVLDAAGVAGRVAVPRRAAPASLGLLTGVAWPQLAAFAVCANVDPSRYPDSWNVPPATTQQLAELHHDLAVAHPESYLVQDWADRLDPSATATVLVRTLPRRASLAVLHIRPEPLAFVHTTFAPNGRWCTVLADDHRTWHERVQELVRHLVRLAPVLDLGFVQLSTGIAGWYGLDGGTPALPGTKEHDFRSDPRAALQHVPDARGAMVLTRSHLKLANELTTWRVRELGNDRFLLLAQDPDAWFAHPTVDPAVLDQGRSELGPMIFRPEG